jgi:AAA domain/Nuclease-related domain
MTGSGAGTVPLPAAGTSADEQAELFDPLIDSTGRQVAGLLEVLRALRRQQRAYRTGSAGERRAAAHVQQVLVDLGATDWHLLSDRRWPGARTANIDLVLVGPPGVVLLDAKAWAGPRIEAGALWRGNVNADESVDKALAMAEAVAGSLADVGLAPAAVHPVLLLVDSSLAAVTLRGVLVVGERQLHRALVRLGPRLDSADVALVLRAVEERCPPAGGATNAGSPRIPSGPRRRSPRAACRPAVPSEHTAPALLDIEAIWAAAEEVAAREPIEAWMTWLHPSQAALATRRYSGPARVRGPAGTGKTVVALHRARQLAQRPGARVLVTSYVRTLPAVQRSLFTRLAPDLLGRVEFLGLHSWALRLLRGRGITPPLAERGGARIFDAAWAQLGRTTAGTGLVDSRDYWWDEIQHVIKGRGLTRIEEYLALNRVGRRTPLPREARRGVWDLYEAYERRLRDSHLRDFCDVLLLALREVQRDPVTPPYSAVIVDEVQDITCVGLRLLHALVGDAADGLLLVGDGQQSVYPGGFTLAEAGISVSGRATVLDRNYRNAAAILDRALEVVRDDVFDDLEAAALPGTRQVRAARPGGQVLQVRASDVASQRAALVEALTWAAQAGVSLGEMAVLVADNRQAQAWAAVLAGAGVPAVLIRDYDGAPCTAVKVGTYQRSKGLEFACVFLPDHDRGTGLRPVGPGATAGEEAELTRRALFVAMTRARDRLWLGSRP